MLLLTGGARTEGDEQNPYMVASKEENGGQRG
jgi:hypothetical protein